jgi:hypothetical protein
MPYATVIVATFSDGARKFAQGEGDSGAEMFPGWWGKLMLEAEDFVKMGDLRCFLTIFLH